MYSKIILNTNLILIELLAQQYTTEVSCYYEST
jgi:hypothetical protein